MAERRRHYIAGDRVDQELRRAKEMFGQVRGYELTPDGGIIILTGEAGKAGNDADELAQARANRDARKGTGARV